MLTISEFAANLLYGLLKYTKVHMLRLFLFVFLYVIVNVKNYKTAKLLKFILNHIYFIF